MTNFTDDIDYKGQYTLYRKLPVIVAGISAGITALGAVVAFIALLRIRPGLACLILLGGAVIAALTFAIEVFLLTLVVSPVIVQTDTLLEISKKLDAGTTTTHTTRTTTTKTVPKWRCPTCGTTNELSATTCAHCFHKKPETKPTTRTTTKWCCPSCGSTNEMTEAVCTICSYRKPQ